MSLDAGDEAAGGALLPAPRQAAFLAQAIRKGSGSLDVGHVLAGGSHPLPCPVTPVPARAVEAGSAAFPVLPPGPLPAWAAPCPLLPGCGFRCFSGTYGGRMKIFFFLIFPPPPPPPPIRALMLSSSPSPPTPIIFPWMIDVPHPAWLQYIHCHAEDVVNSLRVFHVKAADFFECFVPMYSNPSKSAWLGSKYLTPLKKKKKRREY